MDVMDILKDHGFGGGTIIKGTAAVGDVLNNKTFMSAAGKGLLTGTMPENGGVVITPGPNDITIPAGHHDGTGKVSKVSFDASKLLTGTTVAGTPGTMPNQGSPTITPGATDTALAAGYYSGGTVKAAKQFASGTATGDTSTLTFTKTDNTTISTDYITASGLTFIPSVIIAQSSNAMSYYDSTNNYVWCCTGAAVYYIKVDGTNCYVTSTGFRLPFFANPPGNIPYKAYS